VRSLRSLIYPKFRIWKHARRVMVEYDGSTMSVVSDKRLRMAPPPSDPIADYAGQTGFWYCVADANNRTLYRRVIASPLLNGIEVYTNDRTRPLYRIDGSPRKVTLVLVFPDMADSVRLDIFGSQRDPEGRLLPASRVGAVTLDESGRKGGDDERQ
jgi:hypothetical protein